MIEEVKEHLCQVIIPFWKSLRDDVHGGYYGLMDYELNLEKEAVKGCILNSRILWFFSSAYLSLNDESLLEEAKHAYKFLINHCIDTVNGGVFWSLNYDGSPSDTTKHTYNQAFSIYALSVYYEATRDAAALDMAWRIFDLIETRCRDEIGYMEAFDRVFQPVVNDKLSENGVIAHKTMNTLLHIFEAYTDLYRVTGDQRVADRLKWILDQFAEKVYNPKLHRQEVFFDKQMNTILDLHSYGHDIETAWLVHRGVQVLGDTSYEQRMMPIIKDLTENTYKKAFDGRALYNECEQGMVDKSRVWWVQAEALLGFLNGWQIDPKRTEYRDAVKALWNYINNYFVDRRKGSEWFWLVSQEDRPVEGKPIVEQWKCPYHNGRMCLEIIRRNIDVS